MNYYTVAIDGMPGLLLDMKEPLAGFSREHYEETFHKYYEAHRECLDALENGYNLVIDKKQFIENMARALVDAAAAKVEELPKANAKDALMRDFNLCMVAYVFPAVMMHEGNASKPLAEDLQKFWKEQFPKTNIRISDYETIASGFKRKFCYITTAVCETFGKPDDCYELTLLRQYRDSYLMSQTDGEEIVQEYYNLAPTIVKHINKQKKKKAIYQEVWKDYLKPCISMIEDGENEQCKDLYIRMVREMQQRYFFS